MKTVYNLFYKYGSTIYLINKINYRISKALWQKKNPLPIVLKYLIGSHNEQCHKFCFKWSIPQTLSVPYPFECPKFYVKVPQCYLWPRDYRDTVGLIFLWVLKLLNDISTCLECKK